MVVGQQWWHENCNGDRPAAVAADGNGERPAVVARDDKSGKP